MTEGDGTEITFEEFRRAMKEVTWEDFRPVVLGTIKLMEIFGDYIVTLAKFQQKSKETYHAVKKIGESPEAFLATLVDKLPEDRLKPVVELSLRFVELQSKLKKMDELSVKEKIKLGQEVKEVSKKLREKMEDN